MLCVRKAIPRTRSSCGRRSCLRSYNIVLTHAQRARRPPSYIQGNTADKNILSSNPLFVRTLLTRNKRFGKPCLCAGRRTQRFDQDSKQLALGALLARRGVPRSEALTTSWSHPARPGASQNLVLLLRLASAVRREDHAQNSQQLWKTKLPALLSHSS